MTPQLQLSIKLLQQSRMELAETIEAELQSNPVLEITTDNGERSRNGKNEGPEIRQSEEGAAPAESDRTLSMDFDGARVTEKDEAVESPFNEANYEQWEQYIAPRSSAASTFERFSDDDEFGYEDYLTRDESLQEHLIWQLEMSKMDPEAVKLAREIIGNVDDDGYFRLSREELIASMGPDWTEEEKADLDPEFFEAVLERLRTFSPCGVFARSLPECLLIQLEPLGMDDTYVGDIIRNHLEDLEKRRYPQIMKALDITKDELTRALEAYKTLDPRPGRQYGDTGNRYVVPDIYVRKMGEEYVTILNDDGIPNLTISRQYRDMVRRGSEPEQGLNEEAKRYLNDHMRSASWLIKSIQQRQSTIMKVTDAIMKYQHDFLDKGVEHMRPLVLRNIAEEVGMHESTVGRVTTNKFVDTPQGVFELKYFFNSSIQGLDGENFSSESVRAKIRKLIEAEPSDHPLSDTAIVALLKKDDIDIARRTVAKYREAMDIPPSSQRRKLL